jgi:2-methylcitrate dehydratase PrpD
MSGQICNRTALVDATQTDPDPVLPRLTAAIRAMPDGAEDRARAALHLLDWLGCALAGAASPVGQALAPGRPFVGRGAEGARALGGLGSLLEMDDVHRGALLHPGPAVIPAVLACRPDDPLRAMLEGYEAMIRLGRVLGPGHYALFHPTSTCGGLGAAVAAAAALGADPAGSAATALSLAGGLWQCRHEPVATKHIHVAEAARRGVQAARDALAGLGGPLSILDGPQGFFAAFAPMRMPGRVLAGGAGWLIHEVSLKPWPACRHAHPAIDAGLALRDRIAGREVIGVEVATYADAIRFCDRVEPATAGQAQFSLQHALAVVLAKGPPGLEHFTEAACADPGLAALRPAVELTEDPALTAAYPAHFGARVAVRLTGGERLTAEVSDAWGDPENPMDAQAVAEKFRALARAGGVADPFPLQEAVLRLPERGPGVLYDQLDRIEVAT